MLVMHLGTATMRLALAVDRPQGDALVQTYIGLALRELLSALPASPDNLDRNRQPRPATLT